MNNKLLKLNNEYVKLYITSNKELPELLKNSGSLIVYRENSNTSVGEDTSSGQTNGSNNSDSSEHHINELSELTIESINDSNNNGTNYLYLGNELIASGWGFDNIKQKNAAINYLTTLPTHINSIVDVLNNIINSINNNENLYITKDSDLGSYKDLYISTSNFPSSILVDKNNEKNILIKDLPQLLNKATYKEEEITKVEYSIVNEDGNNIEDKDNNINNIIRDDINKCFYVPYNYAKLYLQLKIKLNLNDVGDITNIKFNTYTIKINNTNINTDNYILSIEKDNNTNNTQIITIAKKFTNIDNIIDPDIYITFNKTNNYKNYPDSTDNSLNNLYSIENIIPEHTVRINNSFERYKIIPTYEIYYSTTLLENSSVTNIPEYDQPWAYIGNIQDFSIPSLNDFKKVLIVNENNVTFNIEITNDRYLLIFMIPKLYNINKIMLCSSNNKIKQNILGEFKILYDYGVNNIIYTIIDFDNDNNYYLKFELSKNNINNNTNTLSEININLLDQNIINNTYYLSSDDFDGSHWFNGPENNYILDDVIPNILFTYLNKEENTLNMNNCKNEIKNRFYSINGEALLQTL